VYQLGVEAA
jgi:hypothetical protein